MIQCALRTKNEHIYAYSALGTDALFLYHDICGVALKNTVFEAMTAADIMTAVQIPIMKMVFLFFILWLHSCGKIYRLRKH